MSRIDLHVDELLDRARAGALSASDHARLTAHCEVCVACRMELAWLRDGLHRSAPAAADRALGASAVEALLGGDLGRAAAPPPARARVSWWRAAALACAGLLTASAAAALYTGVQAWRAREVAAQASATQAPSADRTALPAHAHKARPRNAEPAPPDAPLVLQPEPIASPNASTSTRPTPVPMIMPAHSAEALFAHANAERAAGRYEQALADYEHLARTYPRTRSALASRISRADLLLRQMDQPVQALTVYEGYLAARPDGALAEEARVGVAASLQRLGRKDQERTAWQELLDHHPGSLHAERARARLLALSY